MEEGFELIERLKGRLEGKSDAKPLPLMTSCCPGWISKATCKGAGPVG